LSNQFFDKFKAMFQDNEGAKIGTGPRFQTLFRPQRWSYIKRVDADTECVFCRASRLESSFETLVVYKTSYSMVVLNKFPYNTGHLLVIPKRHEGDFLNLTQPEFEDLNHTLRASVEALREVYQPHGINLGLNLDKAAGAGIPDHLHYHVVPRFRGDLNFFPLIAETKVIPESIDETYKKMRTYFSNLRGNSR
jgi:ATP adenylyltransferase